MPQDSKVEARNLLREPLRHFSPYVVGKPIDEVRRELGLTGRIAKLASNENPLGMSPKALECAKKALEECNFYPDDNAYHLRKRISEKFNCKYEEIMVSNGSVEILEMAAYAFLNPTDNIVSSERTFSIYYLAPMKMGAKLKLAPMIDGGYRYDLNAMADLIDENTKIVFLANPTNPTGTWFTKDEFRAFMKKVPEDVLVIYDNAYANFITNPELPDPMEYFNQGRRFLCLYTFSKAEGLAGLRIGFGLGPVDIMQGLNTVRTSFNANSVAQAAALGALDDDEFIQKTRDFTRKELDFIIDELKDYPFTIPPVQTNFLLIDTPKDGNWLFVELQKMGVIVRPMGGYDMPNAIRVSVGTHEDNVNFVEGMKKLFAE